MLPTRDVVVVLVVVAAVVVADQSLRSMKFFKADSHFTTAEMGNSAPVS